MNMAGIALVILGVLVIVLGALQHFMGIFGGSIAHLSIYLGVVGLILAIPGALMSMRRGG